MIFKSKKILIDIPIIVFVKIALFGLIILYAKNLMNILLLLYISFIFASAIRPWINYMYKMFKHKVSYSVCIFIVYTLIILFFIFSSITLLTPIANQFVNLIDNIPDYVVKISDLLNSWRDSSIVLQRFIPSIDSVSAMDFIQSLNFSQLTITGTVTGAKFLLNILPTILYLLLFAWYFLNDRDKIVDFLLNLFVKKSHRDKVRNILFDIEFKLGKWMQGQLLLMFIIGFLSFLGLYVLDIKFAGPLGIIAGFLEIIPTLGPILSVVPAFVVALVYKGWTFAFLVIILYIVIQQLENNLIVPRIMQLVTGTHALLIILSIMLGQALAGGLGAILAVPTLVIIKIILKNHFDFKEDE